MLKLVIRFVIQMLNLWAYLPDNRINIFPNPATGKVAINMLDNISVLKIEVVNMHGNVIKSKIVATGQPVIDVYNLPAGFYILKIYTENGTVTKKLIKR